MSEFNWEEVEQDEYSRSATPSFVKLTTRSYITAMGLHRIGWPMQHSPI